MKMSGTLSPSTIPRTMRPGTSRPLMSRLTSVPRAGAPITPVVPVGAVESTAVRRTVATQVDSMA